MTFTTRNLTGDRVLVQGTDIDGTSGKTVLDGRQWAELNARTDVDKAQQAFDDAVESFFAPIVEAAEAAAKAFERPTDSIGYVVLDEGSEGQAPTPRKVVTLTHDSIVLRLIEEDNTDRLLWVGEKLEVIQASGPTVASSAVSDELVAGSRDESTEG